ncbi:MAG TPA: EamA family transporter [Gemmatimonadaceae bacterium]|jgi:drug/metabolite transporter (DMT)-like permease|nr:EamA family transporter [Gemmatimonadaceae bacterium]
MEPTELGHLPWLAPTLGALFAWGFAQGLVKKYIGEVSAASFCLYYAVANAVVNVAFWAFHDAPPAFAPEVQQFAFWGLLAYVLDGIAWIFYYRSLTYGPISIVGTLSAAYPALTVIFARTFLGEDLSVAQGLGVGAVLLGCLALAWSPSDSAAATDSRWKAYAGAALVIWGVSGTLIRYSYGFPGAHEANLALFIAIGGLLTLGTYGLLNGAVRSGSRTEWLRSVGPMSTMAIGSLLVAIAYKHGPASLVTPLAGAYPVVTIAFAWAVLKERPTRLQWGGIAAVLLGMVLTTVVSGG